MNVVVINISVTLGLDFVVWCRDVAVFHDLQN